MAYLHENKEEFANAVNLASEYFRVLPIIVEKDYYVTMILRELSKRLGFVVFFIPYVIPIPSESILLDIAKSNEFIIITPLTT